MPAARATDSNDDVSESAATTVLQLLPTGAVLIDPDGDVRFANAAAIDMGITDGRSIDVPELRKLARSARLNAAARSVEIRLERGGFPRRVRWMGVRAQPLSDGTVAIVVDDLTEARRVESVRRDFVANVGHEIKTPVGAITLLAGEALEARDDIDALMGFVERINHEALRLARLVQEVLDLSRLQGGEPLPGLTEVAVDAVVDEALDRTRSAAEMKGVELVRGGDVGLRVSGSEAQLVTALSNLLDNAVAYSPDRTRIALGVHERDGVVEIAVSDEGIGIEADEQERIFERFYRVDAARSRATGGTGLGLAIVKHIVSNHDGAVTLWSRPGQGSTFTITLPLAGSHTPTPLVVEGPPPSRHEVNA